MSNNNWCVCPNNDDWYEKVWNGYLNLLVEVGPDFLTVLTGAILVIAIILLLTKIKI